MDVNNTRCVNCSMRLAHQRWRSLHDSTEPMVNVLRTWISPTPVFREYRLCLECYEILKQVPEDESPPIPMFGHRSVCYACGASILRARTHLVRPNCPERNIIIGWMFPHLVPHLTRVCTACWLAARRNIQMQIQHDSTRPLESLNEDDSIAESSTIPVPPLLPQNVVPQPRGPQMDRIILQTYTRALSTSRQCIFSSCTNMERLLIPIAVKELLLSRHRLYVPPSARICRYHLENDCWDQLQCPNRDFTAVQVDQLLNIMEQISLRETLDFENVNLMSPHLCHYWNKSRCITLCRWVVEVVNGRLKRDYKLFRQDFINIAAKHLMDDFRNGCALINKFHPVIADNPEASEYLRIARQNLNVNNILADTVQRENLNRRRATFETIDAHHPHLSQFPRLTISDLQIIALGTYQLKQARSYYGEHVRANGTYTLEINNVIEDDLPLSLGINNYLLRGRIKSRHIGSRTYYTYLLINRNKNVANTAEAISSYCCSCLVGNRTVGCCAHVMSMLWYLGWGRHNDLTAPAQFLDHIFDQYTNENE